MLGVLLFWGVFRVGEARGIQADLLAREPGDLFD